MLSLRENMRLVYEHKTPDYLPLWSDIQRIQTVEPGLKTVVYDGKKPGAEEVDWFGQNWVYDEVTNAYTPDSRNYIVKDMANWRDYVEIPDLDRVDWDMIFANSGVEADTSKFVRVKDGTGLWERALALVDTTELLCALIEEPEACEDFFRTIADHKIKLHNQYIKRYRPDCICMHDDYGSGQWLFMSPDNWRDLIKPHLQRVVENITAQGVMYEHHCCGYMVPLAEEIAEMGTVAWGTVHAVNDPVACKEKFGDKLAFVGGILDGQMYDLPETTEEEIRANVRMWAEKMMPGVGTVMSARCMNFPERNKIVTDELLKSAQQYFKQRRPE